jgi:hypothetical protein
MYWARLVPLTRVVISSGRTKPGRMAQPQVGRQRVQSNAATSPPAGVTAPQNASGEIPGLIVRTLPSNMAAGSPAEKGVCGSNGSAYLGGGFTWNVAPARLGRVTRVTGSVTGTTSPHPESANDGRRPFRLFRAWGGCGDGSAESILLYNNHEVAYNSPFASIGVGEKNLS